MAIKYWKDGQPLAPVSPASNAGLKYWKDGQPLDSYPSSAIAAEGGCLLPAVTATGTGVLAILGSGAASTAALTAQGEADYGITGVGQASLPVLIANGTSTAVISGTIQAVLPALAAQGAGGSRVPDSRAAQHLSAEDRKRLEQHDSPAYKQLTQALEPAQAAASATESAPSIPERIQKLVADANNMGDQAGKLLEEISKRCAALTFAVPAEAVEVRAALVALNLNPDQVSFQDYLQLLELQLQATQEASKQYGI